MKNVVHEVTLVRVKAYLGQQDNARLIVVELARHCLQHSLRANMKNLEPFAEYFELLNSSFNIVPNIS